uniref:Uncharacterized protein n=1 Tax=Wuchereria bancrofti TaxID=6293 RepID=A0AAF5PYE4_WUCBA
MGTLFDLVVLDGRTDRMPSHYQCSPDEIMLDEGREEHEKDEKPIVEMGRRHVETFPILTSTTLPPYCDHTDS